MTKDQRTALERLVANDNPNIIELTRAVAALAVIALEQEAALELKGPFRAHDPIVTADMKGLYEDYISGK